MHVVLSTSPMESAETLARELIERRLAACVNIVPGVRSVYRWEGRIEHTDEALLIIKTSAEALPRLLAELPAAHAYEVPEIVALEVAAAHPPYAAWVSKETPAVKHD